MEPTSLIDIGRGPRHAQACAVHGITPAEDAYMHTYYDVCPWSPPGRYLACLRLPFEDHHPEPDAAADVCVIDLAEGGLRSIRRTTAWGFQTAAKQQWGQTDRYLYFNDKRNGQPVGVRYDLHTGECTCFDGPIWQVSPDETYALCPCLIRANLTQPGYGVSVAAEEQVENTTLAAEDDGFFRVDLATGRNELLLSLADVWEVVPNRDDLRDKILYAFHVKINPQGTRVMLVVRAKPDKGKYHPMLLTCRPDGSGLRVVLESARWRQPVHANHPVWCPDGEKILMNVGMADGRRFALIDADTGEIETLIDEPEGVGHPTLTADGRHLVTDTYVAGADSLLGSIQWVDLRSGKWRDLWTGPLPPRRAGDAHELSRRIDLHPALSRDSALVCFTAAPAGKRRLFIADPAQPADA